MISRPAVPWPADDRSCRRRGGLKTASLRESAKSSASLNFPPMQDYLGAP